MYLLQADLRIRVAARVDRHEVIRRRSNAIGIVGVEEGVRFHSRSNQFARFGVVNWQSAGRQR